MCLGHDANPGGRDRDWAAIGVQGLAPYKFEVEATGYIGTSGRLAARLEGESEVLLTNRLILQPKLADNLYSRDDDENHIGKGLRSEERRVGEDGVKQCRVRWRPVQYKQKIK